jgi:hypothetical protein
MLFMFQQSGEETLTRRVRRLLATDLAAEDENGYGNNKTLLYAPTMILTIDEQRYSNFLSLNMIFIRSFYCIGGFEWFGLVDVYYLHH